MIHLPTAAGGRVQHLVRLGTIVHAGTVLARISPEDGPVEELITPIDGEVVLQRLEGQQAPPYASLVALRRVVVASCDGRVRWIATLGPVALTTMVALIEHQGAIRPHRAGTSGFVGERYVRPGQRVSAGQALIEVRGEELV